MPGYGQYGGFGGEHFHHFAGGPASLLGLMVLPLGLVLFVALCAAAHRVENRFGRRRSPAPDAARRVQALRPTLASDVERDHTARLVSHAVGEGRLSIDEGCERIDAVLRARHRHELTRLVADLPPLAPAPSRRFAATPLRSALLVGASAIVVGALLLQVLAGLWALWPVGVVVLGAAALLPRR